MTGFTVPPEHYHVSDTANAKMALAAYMDNNPTRQGYLSYAFKVADLVQQKIKQGQEFSAVWGDCEHAVRGTFKRTDPEQTRKMVNFLIKTWEHGSKLQDFRRKIRRRDPVSTIMTDSYFPKKMPRYPRGYVVH